MANIGRMRVEWTGVTGMPGLSTFYFTSLSTSAVADVVDFFTDLSGRIPDAVNINVPGNGDLIDETTGALAGVWSMSGAAVVGGTGTGGFASGVGARITWNTAGIVRGRRVRGATFVCPLISAVYDTDGAFTTGDYALLQAEADDLAAGSDLVIWSRPTPGAPTSGSSHAITSATVPDRVTSLRTRRY